MLGTIALGAGSINLLAPGAAFPSGTTCVTDYDLIVCNVITWGLAPWFVLVGVAAIAIAARILLRHAHAATQAGPVEHTR